MAARLVSTVAWILLLASACGCRSNLNQQLLERELRLQEDQIYRLQDMLEEKCARLEHTVAENSSLRRQLGYGAGDRAVSGSGGGRSPSVPSSPSSDSSSPVLVPPTVDLSAPGQPPATLPAPRFEPTPASPPAAPMLEGVPALPAEPGASGAAAPDGASAIPQGSVPPEEAFEDGPSFTPPMTMPQAATGPIQRLSYEESLAAEQGITRIVINRSETRPIDGDGDGVAEGIAIVFEPRDLDERLVDAVGDVSVTVRQASAVGTAPLVASWEVPARDAVTAFRRTSRARGVRLALPWPGPPPDSQSVTVNVRLSLQDGRSFEADAPLELRTISMP